MLLTFKQYTLQTESEIKYNILVRNSKKQDSGKKRSMKTSIALIPKILSVFSDISAASTSNTPVSVPIISEDVIISAISKLKHKFNKLMYVDICNIISPNQQGPNFSVFTRLVANAIDNRRQIDGPWYSIALRAVGFC